MKPWLVKWNSAIWLVWLGCWFVRGKEGGELFDRTKLPKNRVLLAYTFPFAFFLGFGLNEHGRKIRRMMGLGLLGMFGLPVVIGVLHRLWL